MSVIRDLFTSSVNSTMMSIHERFTYLQKNVRPVQTTIMTIRANNSARQQASSKNRRLAMQMEKRLSAMAALKIKKKSIRQRLGVPMVVVGAGSSVRDRLTLPGGGGRGRYLGRVRPNRGRNLRRTQSMQSLPGNLQRSRSMQSLNNEPGVPHRSRSRSRTRNRAPSVGLKEPIARRRRSVSGVRQGRLKKTINTGLYRQQSNQSQRGRRSDSVNFRNRRLRGRGNRGAPKEQRSIIFKRGGGRGSVRGGFQNNRGRGGQFRGRGGRGRGRGRGQPRNVAGPRRNGRPGPVPTKEELDKELEQYMANTKSQLDKDIDTYMKESAEAAEIWD